MVKSTAQHTDKARIVAVLGAMVKAYTCSHQQRECFMGADYYGVSQTMPLASQYGGGAKIRGV
eukprot:680455-Amphidinium_carterae.1